MIDMSSNRNYGQSIYILLLMVAMCGCAGQSGDDREYSSVKERLDEAVRLQFDSDSCNRAMMIYSDIAVSYRPDMPLKTKQLVIDALNRMWYVYYFELFDYADATECLETGLDICETDSIEASRLYLNKGVTYSLLTIRQKKPSDKIFELADYNLKEAHRRASLAGNGNVADYALLNRIVLYDKVSRPVAALDSMLYETVAMHGDSLSGETRFIEALFEIVRCFQNKDYGSIVNIVDSHLEEFPFSPDEARNKYQLLLYKSRALVSGGKSDEALLLLDSIRTDAVSMELYDVLMPVYELKAQAFDSLGIHDESARQMLAYYEQRDNQISEESLMSINELPLIHNIKKSQNNLLREKYRRKVATGYAIISSLFLVSLIALIVVIAGKNRKLKAANMILFKRNEEQLKIFEEKIRRITNRTFTDLNEKEQAGADAMSDVFDDGTEPVPDGCMSDAAGCDIGPELQIIYDKMVEAVECSRLWSDSSLTISQLAVRLKISEKSLSKAIHTCSGLNFNSFINRYRIMEASMMLGNGKEYGHISLQGVAETVGFKSRTTFIAAFKQFVGMLPSAYRKIAMED